MRRRGGVELARHDDERYAAKAAEHASPADDGVT